MAESLRESLPCLVILVIGSRELSKSTISMYWDSVQMRCLLLLSCLGITKTLPTDSSLQQHKSILCRSSPVTGTSLCTVSRFCINLGR